MNTNKCNIFVGFLIFVSTNTYEMPCGDPENKNMYIESSQFNGEETEGAFQFSIRDYDGDIHNEL